MLSELWEIFLKNHIKYSISDLATSATVKSLGYQKPPMTLVISKIHHWTSDDNQNGIS